MYELPIFPLNTVLFPGMPISLHIFEERYKEMINVCLAETKPFGVVLIHHGREVGEPAEPYEIGCLAKIAQVQPFPDGRMNMVAVGTERFRIYGLEQQNHPYLVGQVESLPFASHSSGLTKLGQQVRGQLLQYLALLAKIGNVEFSVERLPEDAVELAYLASTLLQAPNEKKQALLEIDTAGELLQAVYATCREELAVMKVISTQETPPQAGPFSLN